MHNYHDVYKSFPPAAVRDKSGKALLSWRVAILPYIDQRPLYSAFAWKEAVIESRLGVVGLLNAIVSPARPNNTTWTNWPARCSLVGWNKSPLRCSRRTFNSSRNDWPKRPPRCAPMPYPSPVMRRFRQ